MCGHTPGKIAYEKFDKERKLKGDYAAITNGTYPWTHLPASVQETWEDVATAVIEHHKETTDL